MALRTLRRAFHAPRVPGAIQQVNRRGLSTEAPALTQVYGGLKDQDRIFTNM